MPKYTVQSNRVIDHPGCLVSHHLHSAAGWRSVCVSLSAVDGKYEAWEAPGSLDVVISPVLLAVDSLQG